MFTRREFVKSTALAALAPLVPAFVGCASQAAVASARRDGRILVVLHLDGGNDGLNTVAPFADELYAKARPRLRLPAERVLKLDPQVGLHPSLTGMRTLLDRGQLSVVEGVGYPNPNRSHDVAIAIWNTARFDREQHADCGWIGRAFDAAPALPSGTPASILIGRDGLPIAMKSRRAPAAALDDLDDALHVQLAVAGAPPAAASSTGAGSALDFVERTMADARATAAQMREVALRTQVAARYPPSDLARRLQLISQLIQAGFATPVYYLRQRGYDTHTVQLEAHATLLRELGDGLLAFMDDLTAARLSERVAVVVFSEFGRRIEENASLGTDHGTAGPLFVLSGKVERRRAGATPRLDQLDAIGDPAPTVDFRRVYAHLLRDWLQVSAVESLGGEFEPLQLLAT